MSDLGLREHPGFQRERSDNRKYVCGSQSSAIMDHGPPWRDLDLLLKSRHQELLGT